MRGVGRERRTPAASLLGRGTGEQRGPIRGPNCAKLRATESNSAHLRASQMSQVQILSPRLKKTLQTGRFCASGRARRDGNAASYSICILFAGRSALDDA
jgi:hypothetical protein